ncbi:RNA 2'-phosphotransferase [Janthinobacterium fluminis]|uniref:RNA 2'-phosphotransferase n=1 Tax=Janthinobacterium fluminis TaxID=2987524 RepID=UPI003B439C33
MSSHPEGAVDLGLSPAEPPATLYHGTAERFIASIKESGSRPGARKHVRLSSDLDTAVRGGARHGAPVVLTVRKGRCFICRKTVSG